MIHGIREVFRGWVILTRTLTGRKGVLPLRTRDRGIEKLVPNGTIVEIRP